MFIIARGLGYFKAWAKLYDRDEETAHALNRYRGFIASAERALKDMALLEFAKAFDRDPRTSSMRVLLKEAQSNRDELAPHSTEADLIDLESQINDNQDLLERLKGARDQRIAHLDVNFKGYKLLYGEMNKLAEDIQSMYNSLSSWHDREIASFDSYVRDTEKHTSEVVELIREEYNRISKKPPYLKNNQ